MKITQRSACAEKDSGAKCEEKSGYEHTYLGASAFRILSASDLMRMGTR